MDLKAYGLRPRLWFLFPHKKQSANRLPARMEKKIGDKSELTSMKLKNLDESVCKLNKSLVTVTHEQIIICRQLYADHVVNSRLANEKEKCASNSQRPTSIRSHNRGRRP